MIKSTQVHAYTWTRIHKYTSTQVHKYTSTQVHKYTSTQVHKYTSTQVHKYTSQGRLGTCKNCVTCVSQIGNTKANPELEKSRKFVTHMIIF